MNRRNFIYLLGCGCFSLGIHSCTTAPITERRQLKLIPESKLNAQAAAIFEKVKEKEKLITEHREIKSKLNNSNFIQKAPENIIEQFKNQEKSIKSSIEKLDQIIDSIK